MRNESIVEVGRVDSSGVPHSSVYLCRLAKKNKNLIDLKSKRQKEKILFR